MLVILFLIFAEYHPLSENIHLTMSAQDRLRQGAGRNATLLQGLSETEYAVSALSESQAYIGDLSREISQCNRQLRTLSLGTKREKEEHDHY